MLTITITQNTVFKSSTNSSVSLPPSQKTSISKGQSFQVKSYLIEKKHCKVWLLDAINPVGKVGYFFAEHVEIDEIRGVWLTNIDSDVLFSLDNIKEALVKLKELKFNTIYPTVWQGGLTLYPSEIPDTSIRSLINPVDPRLLLVDPDVPTSQKRDMLKEIVKLGHEHGFRVIPWFEFGLMAPPTSNLATTYKHLLMEDGTGKTVKDGNVWLNPFQPEVQKFIVDLITDAVSRYDIDGIQLDDHFGIPIEMGYDSFTRNLYMSETGDPDPISRQNSTKWKDWRINAVTNLVKQIFAGVKAIKNDCIISISPNPLDFSIDKFLADWQKWEQAGFAEEIVLQNYVESSFVSRLKSPEIKASKTHIPTIIGINTGLKKDRISSSKIKGLVQEVRNQNFSGVSFFFYETLINEKLEPSVIARDQTELNKMFG
jgi:uncharacterized lipoprotein YddW (UPF0748 family)